MNDEETTTAETTETTETDDDTTTAETEATETETDYRSKLNIQNRFLEKEGYEFKGGKWIKKGTTTAPPAAAPQQEKKEDLSVTDIYALRDAKVPLEDVEEVKKAAKLLGVTIPEALKDAMLQSHLEKRAELRRTAEANNRGPSRRGAAAPTDAEVLDKANKGEIPAKGSKEAEQLFFARRKR